jgi:carbamoyltransferase
MSLHKNKQVILGVGGYLGHDANAALLVDGALIAASQEERFSRRKHDGRFPVLAIADCLAQAGLGLEDVDVCVFAEKPMQSVLFDASGVSGNALTRLVGRLLPERMGGLHVHEARRLLPSAQFRYAWHHLSHVAGAFHTSPFSKAAFLCVDGKGEDYSASAGIIDDGQLKILFEQPYENGLGLLYTLVTHHLGFPSFGSEYKVMGLAPYGRPVLIEDLSKLFATDERGGLRLHQDVKFRSDSMATAVALVSEATGVPALIKGQPLTEAHVNLAASLQKIFETEVMKMARFVRHETGEQNLIFCGGCAQNCVAAGRLRSEGIFDTLFNSPVGGDMGSGLGAAILYARQSSGGRRLAINARGFYLGSEPGLAPEAAEPWRVKFDGHLHDFVAGEIAAGKTVGWVRGRMELGARALGARSIFADPRAPGMQSRLNLAVKFRESFRPFAPAILAEDVGEWFDSSAESDYMNYTANLLPERRALLPEHYSEFQLKERLDFPRSEIQSVIHVDFSARLQTLHPDVHPDFHALLTAFKKITGVPIMINTSFNVAGQPIVRTAAEAWDCFVNTDLDLLVLNDEVYCHPGNRTLEEKHVWLNQFAKSA